ncbi:MAG: hypothetical protein HDS35_07555 [Bacteroides sp.]|nr:hypothetical protein [Bacteroides sp.]
MRPIKLRAKTNDGEWAAGNLCFDGLKPPQIIWVREDQEVIETDIFDHATIGMYAGFRDKNGKEICEGDIVHFVNPGLRYDLIAPVVFDNGDFCLYKDVNYLIPMGNFSNETFEVIGNIFDNPDLVKR